MSKSKYPSCAVAGGGKVLIKDTEAKGEFRILQMSAEEIEIETSLELVPDTLVDLKISLDSILFEIDIDATGRVVEKLEPTEGYRVEFIQLSDKVKAEIDEIMRNSCNLT